VAREIDVPERYDSRGKVSRVEGFDHAVEVRVGQPREKPSKIRCPFELLPELLAPPALVLVQYDARSRGTSQGPNRGFARDLGCSHAQKDPSPGQGLYLGGRVAHQDDSGSDGAWHIANRDAGNDERRRIPERRAEPAA
jgi:hypothetical protein